jgi:hypothetical protein
MDKSGETAKAPPASVRWSDWNLPRSDFRTAGGALILAATSACLNSGNLLAQAVGITPPTTAVQLTHSAAKLTIPTAQGTAVAVNAEIDNWNFPPGNTPLVAPAGGATVVYLRNGNISATIGGTTHEYHPGNFWSVPGGTEMTVSVHPPAEGAILQTITAAPGQ